MGNDLVVVFHHVDADGNQLVMYSMRNPADGTFSEYRCVDIHASRTCPNYEPKCGDGVCDDNPTDLPAGATLEDATSCPQDCAVCGDGECAGDETADTCPEVPIFLIYRSKSHYYIQN
jgi:hypothetical protein